MRRAIGGTNPSRADPRSRTFVADGSHPIDPHPRDPRVLSTVYRAHSAYVWRVLRHCGVPDEDLDDAVQETFLVVLRRLHEFEGRAALRTWIYAVAVRVASTRRRSQRREQVRRERAGAQVHGASTVDPERALCRAEAAELVDHLLDELDPPKRTVFVLAELEGVKVPEISRILGVNPRTVHSRLRLARERFGTALRRLEARTQGNRRVARQGPRGLLDEAANARPPAGRRTAVGAALALRLEQGAMPRVPGWDSWTVTSASTSGAWGVSIAVIVAASAVASWSRLASDPAPRGSSPAAPMIAHADHDRPPGSTPPAEPTAASDAREPSAATFDTPSATATPAAPRDSTAPVRHRPTAPITSATASTTSEPAPEPTAPEPADPERAPASTLAEETQQLEQARAALRRGEALAALAVVDEHLRRFPRGLLVDEARSTRLRALCAAGRHDQAQAFAHALSGGAASSRWHRIVSASCSAP